MADLNLKVGDIVELRNGDVVGPLSEDGHFQYPWSVIDKPHLTWTIHGQWSWTAQGENQMDIVRVVMPGAPDEEKLSVDSDKIHFDLYRGHTVEDGVICLVKWPEGYVLWYHGQIVWKSWEPTSLMLKEGAAGSGEDSEATALAET